jgi:hypothetical protein
VGVFTWLRSRQLPQVLPIQPQQLQAFYCRQILLLEQVGLQARLGRIAHRLEKLAGQVASVLAELKLLFEVDLADFARGS